MLKRHNYNTTINSCDCPDRKYRGNTKAACKHMQRLIDEIEYKENLERQLHEVEKQHVRMWKATRVNKYVGEWCGCPDHCDIGLVCIHIHYLRAHNLNSWEEVNVEI